MKIIIVYYIIILLPVLLISCATTQSKSSLPKAEDISPPAETKKEIPHARKQENKSLNIFTDILDLTESTNDRKSILPQIEKLYTRIIDEYPNVPLAQESYWKLIELNLKEYNPPRTGKANMLYKEFVRKYPESTLRPTIEDTLGKGLYQNAEWKELRELCAPTYIEYVENKKHPRASMLFMYAEANYYLENISEAVKGYEVAAELYPKLREGQKAIVMINMLTKKKKLETPRFNRKVLRRLTKKKKLEYPRFSRQLLLLL
jgi:hypothetical protein